MSDALESYWELQFMQYSLMKTKGGGIMRVNRWLIGLSLSLFSLLFIESLGGAQDFCGEGNMAAILDTIPPCSNPKDSGNYRDHFGDFSITLIDCGTGDTVGTIEQAIHILPECPDTLSGSGTFPPGGVDTIIGTTGEIILNLITPPVTETLTVGGDMRILRSDPYGNPDTIDTEILSMELVGTSPSLGPIRVRAGSDFGLNPSLGNIISFGGSDFPAYSTFDILFEITPLTGVEEQEERKVKVKPFILHEITPNPLTHVATIRFGLLEPGWVSLKVYNLLGERVKTLVEGNLNAGLHRGIWDLSDEIGKEVSSGVYFYQLTKEGISETKRLVLIR